MIFPGAGRENRLEQRLLAFWDFLFHKKWCESSDNVYNIERLKDNESYSDYLYKHISEINNEITRWHKILYADYQRWLLDNNKVREL